MATTDRAAVATNSNTMWFAGDPSLPRWKRLWNARVRIGVRLVVYFSGAALLTLLASVISYVFFTFLDNKLKQINEENVPQMFTAFEVAQESAALGASLPRLSSSTREDFDAIVSSVHETQAKFDEFIATILKTESGRQRATELLDAGTAMRSNINQTVDVVERRFELLAASAKLADDVNRLHDLASAHLQEIVDDQLFFAMTGYRELTDSTPVHVGTNSTEFELFRHLSEIEHALESSVEVIGAAFNETDANLLVPLLERFEASQATIENSAKLLPASLDVSSAMVPIQELFELNASDAGVFSLQAEILRLNALEEQYIASNRAIVENLYQSGGALVAEASNDTNVATGEAEMAATMAIYLLIGLNVFGIAGVVVIVYLFVIGKLVRRFDTLAGRMLVMADGDLEVEVPIEGNDELATMAEALEVFRQKSLEALRLNEVERLNAELAQSNDQLESMNTELKAAQQQIVMREKLAAMGELTAGVAHEIKNPLNFMMNFSEVSQELMDELFEELEMEGDERDEELIKEIQQDLLGNLKRIHEHGDRANSIVRDMLAMGRESSDWVPTDLNRVLSEHARLAFHSARANDSSFQLDIKEELAEDLPEIEAIPTDLARVFLNMFMNACYAVNKRRVEHEDASDYAPVLTLRSKLDGDVVEIQIEDNGTGVEKDEIEKIFQPFFTTKPTDEGTGLGLALAADIVHAHGGSVTVDSEVMNFTRMTIRLPLRQIAEVQESTNE